MYIKNNINSEVSLASQTHHVPHIGLPHIDPVTKARNVKSAPTYAADLESISKTLIFQISAIIEQKNNVLYANNESHALGTCT